MKNHLLLKGLDRDTNPEIQSTAAAGTVPATHHHDNLDGRRMITGISHCALLIYK